MSQMYNIKHSSVYTKHISKQGKFNVISTQRF